MKMGKASLVPRKGVALIIPSQDTGKNTMKPKRIAVIIAIFSILFVVYELVDTLVISSKSPQSRKPKVQQAGVPLCGSDAKKAATKTDEAWRNFIYPADKHMRNPFERQTSQAQAPRKESPTTSLTLAAILYNTQSPVAILKDKDGASYLARENEKILDFTVKKIMERSVVLSRGGSNIRLDVFDEKKLARLQLGGL